jgi:hypothetical protein
LKIVDQLKMPTIIRQYGEFVAQSGRADPQVEIANSLALRSQPTALATKDPGGFVIDAEQFDAAEERLKCLFALHWVAGIENPFIELGERYEREGKALRTEILDASNDLWVTVEVMNHPIGVDQISQGLGIG